MALVGFNDLQGRSAYQPIIQQQVDGSLPTLVITAGSARNPLHGQTEPNGTSIVDVTDPQHPAICITCQGQLVAQAQPEAHKWCGPAPGKIYQRAILQRPTCSVPSAIRHMRSWM